MGRKAGFTASDKRKTQAMLISILEKSPLVAHACKKVGISRMTFHRWKEEDKDFAHDVKKALDLSREDLNDFAESKLIENIQEGSMVAIRFWLENNKKGYKKANRRELENEEERSDTDTIFILPDNHFQNEQCRQIVEQRRERNKKNWDIVHGREYVLDPFYKSKGGQDHFKDNFK